MPDPKYAIELQYDQISLDTFKAITLSDPSQKIPLLPLDGLALFDNF